MEEGAQGAVIEISVNFILTGKVPWKSRLEALKALVDVRAQVVLQQRIRRPAPNNMLVRLMSSNCVLVFQSMRPSVDQEDEATSVQQPAAILLESHASSTSWNRPREQSRPANVVGYFPLRSKKYVFTKAMRS